MSAGAGAIRAGRAFVELLVVDNTLTAGLKASLGKLRVFGQAVADLGAKLSAVGGIVLSPVMAATTAYASQGKELLRLSAATGVSVAALSTLRYAAERSGVSAEALSGGLSHLEGTLAAALTGSDEARQAFTRLGLSVDQLRGMSADERFRAVADAAGRIENPALRASRAMDILGDSALEMDQLFESGANGIREFEAEARRAGQETSRADALLGRQFLGSLNSVAGAVRLAATAIGRELLPVMNQIVAPLRTYATGILYGARALTTWIRQNKDAVTTAVRWAAGLVAAGTALVALGGVIVGAAIGVAKIGAAFVAVKVAVVTGLGLAAGLLGALLSPIGLVTIAVVGLGAYLLSASGAWGAAVNWFGDQWRALAGTVATAWGGIVAAIQTGDLQGALNIAVLGATVIWTRFTGQLRIAWAETTAWLADAWDVVVSGLAVALAEGGAVMRRGWLQTTTWIADAWDTVSTGTTTLIMQALGGWSLLFLELGEVVSRVWENIMNAAAHAMESTWAALRRTWARAQAFVTGGNGDEAAAAVDADAAKHHAHLDEAHNRANLEREQNFAARRQQVDEEVNRALTDEERERNARIRDRGNAQRAGLAEIDRRENGEVAALGANQQAAAARRAAGVQGVRDAAAARTQGAQGELGAAVGEAQFNRWASRLWGGARAAENASRSLAPGQQRFNKIALAVGGFVGDARQFGGRDAATETAQNTAQAVDQLRRLNDRVENLGQQQQWR
jgi:hypothetical protein